MNTYTAAQAHLIARTLDALDALPYIADGQYLRIDLMDELFENPVGHFTNDEGTWLFETSDPIKPQPITLDDVARMIFAEDKELYARQKITFIKVVRNEWNRTHPLEDLAGLKETKEACERIIQEDALAALRDKLVGEPYMHEDDVDRAYAEHRERMAEQGTWFGVPGPMDEEPF